MSRNIVYVPVTVADAGTTSAAVDTSEHEVVGVYLPTGLEGTTLAFTMAPEDDGTFVPVREAGAAAVFSQTVAAANYVAISPNLLAGARWIKVVLASQTGAYTAQLALRRLGA